MTSFHEIDLKMVMTVKNEKDKFEFYSGIIAYNTSVVITKFIIFSKY